MWLAKSQDFGSRELQGLAAWEHTQVPVITDLTALQIALGLPGGQTGLTSRDLGMGRNSVNLSRRN